MCVCVWGLRTKAGNSFVSFRFCLLAFFSTAQAGVLPKWPSSNSSDIFRQLSDSQVWHPQHKAKVKWHRRSHRAGWAGNRHRQPAAGSNFAATQKVCSSFLYPFFFYLSFSPFLCSVGGFRVRQPPARGSSPTPDRRQRRRRRRRRRQLLLIIKSLSIKA